jgi:hypothetical protein
MNKKLVIQLVISPDCKLVAIDNSDYLASGVDLENYVMIDFIRYNIDNCPVNNSVQVRKEIHKKGHYLAKFTSAFLLKEDGTYSYYKLVVPLLDFFLNIQNKYTGIKNQLFFYNRELYKCSVEDNDAEYDIDTVLANSEKINNYIEAYEYVQSGNASQTLYSPEKKVFSACKMQKCLVNLQKQLLMSSHFCNSGSCDVDQSLRDKRDFLFSAMYVFDYLKDLGNFTEAQRILDNMSSCDTICKDNFNNCSCGSSI